ncbi:MAG: hypothetical protein QOJ12_3385 [Thermoleophilales bacterium]|jgi:hypothetical protein|nr:hypothetical protein [Thermoleophilales bacterium]
MKRLASLGIALIAAVLGTAAVTASGHSGHAASTTVLRADFKTTAVKVVDAAPPGESPGDLGVVGGNLFAHGSSRQIGHYQGTCYTMAPKSNSECTFTFSLAGGQITVISAYGKGFNGSKVVHDAVVGGTRAYRNARGEGIGIETSDTTGTETIHLSR